MPSKNAMVASAGTAAVLATASVASRPFFSSGVVATLSFGVWFVANEDREIHDSNEMDDYCLFIALLLSSTYLVRAPDSPFKRLGPYGWVLPLAAPWLFNMYSRRRHRRYLEAGTEQAQAHWPRPRLASDTSHVAKLVVALRAALGVLDLATLPTLCNAWIRFQKVLRAEKQIHDTFADQDLGGEELSTLVADSPLSLLMYKVKNHLSLALTWGTLMQLWRRTDTVARTLRRPESMPFQSRANFIKLLAYERVHQLSTLARAVVVDSLQRVRLTTLEAEPAVAHILRQTHGAELTLLKNLCDSKGTHHSLHRLVFSDVVNEELRQDILAHFRAQAPAARKQLALRRELPALRKVMSDVDDTFICSGGSYPAGIDARMRKHQLYPGASRFLRSLDRSFGLLGEHWSMSGSELGNITFLSARPRMYKGALENALFTDFAKLKEQGRFHCMPSMLAGNLETGWAYMRHGNFEPMAEKKFLNFIDYARLYPEYSFVFVGDNGQGDLAAGTRMVASRPDIVEAVFIHVVQPNERTYGISGLDSLDPALRNRIVFFHDYVEAATEAAARSLFPVEDLVAIAGSARAEFAALSFTSAEHREAGRVRLNTSLKAASTFWISRGAQAEALDPLPEPSNISPPPKL